MTDVSLLLNSLPDPQAAERFLTRLAEEHPSQSKRLFANKALLSDIATLVSNSPLFATTLLQIPEHIAWLGRKRMDSTVRNKQELLESLARFSLTNSQLETHVILARFRRRELMRIFLRDVRRLSTVSEITEEISNLADAILEHALRISRQELDNRFGSPQERDERGRMRPARFCIVSLGKLGSRELNYSSDIDLIFIYSLDGTTTGSGSQGSTTNLEYFTKLAQSVIKLVGGQGGEGSAYRVDLRLRPNGRIGPLALPLDDTIRYYRSQAAGWERQVLIRARSSAGDEALFRSFYSQVEPAVFSTESTTSEALENVRRSKQQIDLNKRNRNGVDVKLDNGGIREIEFIAQALQLAYGARDAWLRTPHTLISLTRLSERGHISHSEQTVLFDAYDFLRRLEHVLQMENGLQTHLVSNDEAKLSVIARRMGFEDSAAFRRFLENKMSGVSRIFHRVFGSIADRVEAETQAIAAETEIFERETEGTNEEGRLIRDLRHYAPRFASIVESRRLAKQSEAPTVNYLNKLSDAVDRSVDFGDGLRALRMAWTECLLDIVIRDVAGELPLNECKRLQTELAEASIAAAWHLVRGELERRYKVQIQGMPIATLALGKLGGGGMDYDSDLDLVLVYEDEADIVLPKMGRSESAAKAVEIFTNVLSSVTRDGSLYRVDLRLRPHGGKGPVVSSRSAFVEYFSSEAAIWEMLAFVKLRAVGGDIELAKIVEDEVRSIIHSRAVLIDVEELARETRSVRNRLEKQKLGRRRRSTDIDIKYGEGGLLDVYFAVRYLQLRYNVPDDSTDRSTLATIKLLASQPSLVGLHASLSALRSGYEFLASLDHSLRLIVGRTSRLPAANQHAVKVIAERMKLSSPNEVFEQLTLHRLAVRTAFDTCIEQSNDRC